MTTSVPQYLTQERYFVRCKRCESSKPVTQEFVNDSQRRNSVCISDDIPVRVYFPMFFFLSVLYLHAVVPISVILLFEDGPRISETFISLVGDMSSLWFLFAISQQYIGMPQEYSTSFVTPVCCARYPYNSPFTCSCMPPKPDWRGHWLLIVSFVSVAIVNYRTRLVERKTSVHQDDVLTMSCCLAIAPLMFTVGFPKRLVFETNLIVSCLVVIAGSLSLTVRTARVAIDSLQHFLQVNASMQKGGITLMQIVWCSIRWPVVISWLFIGVMFVWNQLFADKSTSSVNGSLVAGIWNSMNSSPFAFIGLSVASAYFLCIVPQLVISFVCSTVVNLRGVSADVHGQWTRTIFFEGTLFQIFHLSAGLLIVSTYILQIPSTVLLTLRSITDAVDIPKDSWFKYRKSFASVVLFAIPILAVYCFCKIYGWKSIPTVIIWSSLVIYIDLIGSLIKYAVRAADGKIKVCLWSNVNDALRVIEV